MHATQVAAHGRHVKQATGRPRRVGRAGKPRVAMARVLGASGGELGRARFMAGDPHGGAQREGKEGMERKRRGDHLGEPRADAAVARQVRSRAIWGGRGHDVGCLNGEDLDILGS